MTDNFPITPPPELVRTWMERTEYDEDTWFYESYIAEQAARWGANQELEACCEWLADDHTPVLGQRLRAARRPKPPSLKKQALGILGYPKDIWCEDDIDTIRRALEQLDD